MSTSSVIRQSSRLFNRQPTGTLLNFMLRCQRPTQSLSPPALRFLAEGLSAPPRVAVFPEGLAVQRPAPTDRSTLRVLEGRFTNRLFVSKRSKSNKNQTIKLESSVQVLPNVVHPLSDGLVVSVLKFLALGRDRGRSVLIGWLRFLCRYRC